MISKRFALFTLAPVILAGCASVQDLPTERLGSATLRTSSGVPAGTAQLYGNGTAVNISIGLAGLPAGVHGVHLHMVGSCDGTNFSGAGGHLNPGAHQHGTDNPMGSHLGDLPNVTIGASGAGTGSATLRGTRAEILSQIFDGDGAAVVVHAKADDYKTDPSGNSGDRIACGVLSPA